MTVEEVKEAIKRIDSMSGDDEAAHSAEDDLHQEVLAAIADGTEHSAELAKEALKTLDISFARWCA